jgi:hypothetical protein
MEADTDIDMMSASVSKVGMPLNLGFVLYSVLVCPKTVCKFLRSFFYRV